MMRHAGRPPGPNDRVLKLPDGRLLGYAEFGDPAGEPLFFFHGNPGSRFGGAFLDAAAKARGVRVVALERPGFGLSDFQHGRTIADWPADVREAARHFGFDRFAVLGFSAGGPYALACAAAMSHSGEGLTAVGVVSGVGLSQPRAGNGLVSHVRASLVSLLARRAPGLFFRWAARRSPPPDRAILSRPAARAALLQSEREAFRHGSRGVIDETALLARPWGVDFAAITASVRLWHGKDDRTVPVSGARAVADALPECVATFVPGGGHFWLLDHGGEVLDALFPGEQQAEQSRDS